MLVAEFNGSRKGGVQMFAWILDCHSMIPRPGQELHVEVASCTLLPLDAHSCQQAQQPTRASCNAHFHTVACQ
eukprot:1844734-Amphidinium_carterae.1